MICDTSQVTLNLNILQNSKDNTATQTSRETALEAASGECDFSFFFNILNVFYRVSVLEQQRFGVELFRSPA